MGISVELRKSSKQQNNSKPVQERVVLPPANRVPKHPERSTVTNHFDPLHSSYPRCELTKEVRKYSGNQCRQSNKANAVEDGELVKHMTNLPSYLKRVEKAENFQDKALNVGVLDWTRLEQWKHKQKNVLDRGSSSASCSSSSSSSLLTKSSGSSKSSSLVHTSRLSEHHSSTRSSVAPSRKNDLPRNIEGSVRNAVCLQDFIIPSVNTVAEQKNVSQSFNSSGKSNSGTLVDKEKIKGISEKIPSEMRRVSGDFKHISTSLPPKKKSSFQEVSEETHTRKTLDQKIISEEKAKSSKLADCDVSLSSRKKNSARSVRTHRVQDLKQSNIDLADQSRPEQGNKIVLLLPKDSPQKGSPEVSRLPWRRASFDKSNTGSRKCSFSDDVCTKDISSDIPHSCPLPSSVETNVISDAKTNGMTTVHRIELSSASSNKLPCSEKAQDLNSECEYGVKSKLDIKPPNSNAMYSMEMVDEEDAGLTGSKSRNPSPHRRFSFSLGRMGRSLSFKEGTVVPQLRSTNVTVKSGPVSCDPSNSVDNPNKEKVKGHNRARSSPLRRLLDPIIKHKEANPPHHPEFGYPPKGNFYSFSSGPVYSFPSEKLEESRVQALLQLKVNSGIPLFKFVVNNNSNILAATMRSLASSDKDDSGRSYTFYLVNEIKKKSGGWISQGSKEKNYGYAYNVVGQMKVSTSDISDTSGQDCNRYRVKESVLFAVERKQADQGSPKFIPNRELAAAVIRIPKPESILDQHQVGEESMEKWGYPESQYSNNGTTVILPGGVHSTPNKGEPSPLIDRWRSGGTCDCGGWDVGCKLQVLSDQSKCAKGSKSFKDGRILDSFELFVQGVEQQNGPLFSLVLSKDGIYSVEYNTSISRLQAFFICVAVLSAQKVPDVSLEGNVSESKPFDQPDMSGDRRSQAKFPAKYAANPPLSPVGRV